MKKSTTAQRLNKIMRDKNLSQADIIRLSKPYEEEAGTSLTRSAMSQYVSGIYEPDQKKLSLLSKALGVSEVWLMGYDVVPTPEADTANLIYQDDDFTLTSSSRKLEDEKTLRQALLICTSPVDDRPSREDMLYWLRENVRSAAFTGANYEDRDDESLYQLYKELRDEAKRYRSDS